MPSVQRGGRYGREGRGTFSIVAGDPTLGVWGVAVATKPICVGSVVPWAEWRVGALATQALSNYFYGPQGLELLRRGATAEETVRRLTRADRKREHRQLAVVDRRGRVVAWTGKKCIDWAGHVPGEGFSCQGNMLANDRVVPAMVRAFEQRRGRLAGRLLAALQAGQRAGGDRRGLESAALLVVHREPWYDKAWPDRVVDLRVDQHARPLAELARLLAIDERVTRSFRAARRRRLSRR